MQHYDIPALERALEAAENNDAESHKLYNNLGLAYSHIRKYRLALRAHREEKRACKRLLQDNPESKTHLLDLAIAYRRCGDAMLKVDRLVDADGELIDARVDVLKAAGVQHRKGLEVARRVGGLRGDVEVQAACAALSQSALALALEMRSHNAFVEAARCCHQAALLADKLVDGAVSRETKESMLLGASLNMAIALSGLSQKEKARNLLHAIALRARKIRDDASFVRAVSNLAEEAGDDDDWELCETYVREWVRIASGNADDADEADALRKLAVALRERGDYDGAVGALNRAIAIGSRNGRQEAREFLTVVEGELAEMREHEREMSRLEAQAATFSQAGNFVEEAKTTLLAGNCAFALKRAEDVARLLGRYFQLVDEYGCNTAVTGIDEPAHNSAVANIGEAMWKLRRYEEAVKWATRELTAFEDDVAGQAQAWCNLGVYLDDFGKREKAVEALRKSIELAHISGEEQVLKRAQNNLEVVQAELLPVQDETDIRDEADLLVPDGSRRWQDEPKALALSCRESEATSRILSDTLNTNTRRGVGTDVRGENTVTAESRRPHGKNADLMPVTEYSPDVSITPSHPIRCGFRATSVMKESGHANGSHGNQSRSRSHQSRGGNTADRSSAGFRHLMDRVDLISDYKALCAKRQPPVRVRPMIVEALKALSSKLRAKEVIDDLRGTPEKLNISSLFLNGQDVSVILETLSCIGGECSVLVDLSLNPLIPPTAYACLCTRFSASFPPLLGIKQLNMACAGVSGNALRHLAVALGEEGSLPNVTMLNISKNALGRQSKLTAYAVARLITNTASMEKLDLSLNLLPHTFIADLMNNLTKVVTESGVSPCKSPIKSIDLRLNNRCAPSGLLEVDNPQNMAKHFAELFNVIPGLERIDVRACGASLEMRKALRDLPTSFDSFSKSIITLSETILEET